MNRTADDAVADPSDRLVIRPIRAGSRWLRPV